MMTFISFFDYGLRLHGRRVNFKRGCQINGQTATNVEHSFQNNNIQKNLPPCYLIFKLIYI